MIKVSLKSCEINTWADAETVFVTSPHAGTGVSDSRHVGVHLHGAQGVLRYAVIYCTIMIHVTLQMKKNNIHKECDFFGQVQVRFNYDTAIELICIHQTSEQ